MDFCKKTGEGCENRNGNVAIKLNIMTFLLSWKNSLAHFLMGDKRLLMLLWHGSHFRFRGYSQELVRLKTHFNSTYDSALCF